MAKWTPTHFARSRAEQPVIVTLLDAHASWARERYQKRGVRKMNIGGGSRG